MLIANYFEVSCLQWSLLDLVINSAVMKVFGRARAPDPFDEALSGEQAERCMERETNWCEESVRALVGKLPDGPCL